MEDLQEQLSNFNELQNFGIEFLAKIEKDFEQLEKNYSDSQANLNQVTGERDNLRVELNQVTGERDNLRDEVQKLNDTNRQLAEALRQSQKDVEKIKDDFNKLLDKLKQVRTFLAGEI